MGVVENVFRTIPAAKAEYSPTSAMNTGGQSWKIVEKMTKRKCSPGLGKISLQVSVCTPSEWIGYREELLDESGGRSIRYALMEKEGMYEELLGEIAERSSDRKRYQELVCYLNKIRKQDELRKAGF